MRVISFFLIFLIAIIFFFFFKGQKSTKEQKSQVSHKIEDFYYFEPASGLKLKGDFAKQKEGFIQINGKVKGFYKGLYFDCNNLTYDQTKELIKSNGFIRIVQDKRQIEGSGFKLYLSNRELKLQQPSYKEEDLRIIADRVLYNMKEKKIEFYGNVNLKRGQREGTFSYLCLKLDKEDKIESFFAKDSTFTQKEFSIRAKTMEGNFKERRVNGEGDVVVRWGDVEALGDEFIFFEQQEILKIFGNVNVKQKNSKIYGKYLEIDFKNQTFQMKDKIEAKLVF